jgi:spoIIIJ-associated protein
MFDEKFLTQKLDKFVALLEINSVVEYDFLKTEEAFFIKVSFRGENLGHAIGYRGKNIQAMQYVLNLMLKKLLQEEENIPDEEIMKLKVLVDVGDYREQNVKKLKKMVDEKVEEARALGEYIELPPMSPPDRREIHLHCKDLDDIKTESFGEGNDRAVRIIPSSEENLAL